MKLLFFVVILFISSMAHAMNWDKAIQSVEEKSKKYSLAADKRNEPVWLGTMYNEWRIPEHKCSILGRMLGKTHLIGHLEEESPQITEKLLNTVEEYSNLYRLEAHNLSNWVHTAKLLRGLDYNRKIQIWNLDCVGEIIQDNRAYIRVENAQKKLFFDISRDGESIRILGEIETGFYKKLVDALNLNPQVNTIALGSGGGSVVEAIKAGLEIRKRKLDTTLWNNCFSACPLVFMGGVRRTIWSPYPNIGLHQFSINGEAISLNSNLYKDTFRYVKALGSVDRNQF